MMIMAPLFKSCRWGGGTVVLTLALGFAPTVPVSLAQELLPELAEPAAKHKAADEALDKQKQEAAVLAARSYMSALDGVEKSATAAGQLDVVAAVVKEREAVASGSLEQDLPKALPKAKLQSPRKTLLASIERVNADFAKRKKTADADYLRVLAALQSKAAENPELAKQIAAEKAVLLGSGSAATGTGSTASKASRGKNAVVNGDFEKIVDGKPEGWGGVKSITLQTEKKGTFARFDIKPDKEGKGIQSIIWQSARIEIPAQAKRITVSARLRASSDIKSQYASTSVCVKFCDEIKKEIGIMQAKGSCKKGVWSEVQSESPIPVGSVCAGLEIYSGMIPGQIDLDDIEVTFK